MAHKDIATKLASKLTKLEINLLKKEIAQICEKQYRKGYQHGHDHTTNNWVTTEQVVDFRHKGSLENYTKVSRPPHFQKGAKDLDFISQELGMKGVDFLQKLFNG